MVSLLTVSHWITLEVLFVCKFLHCAIHLLNTYYFDLCFIAGLVSGLIEVNRLFSIDLYDTTMDYQDVRISDELIKSQLMWPNMSLDQTDSSQEKEKYVNPKVPNLLFTSSYRGFWRQNTFKIFLS